MTDYGIRNTEYRILIGGVGYRWMRDAAFGLIATDHLALLDWPEHIEVADLGYGAIYVAQDLGDAEPPYDCLILLAGVERDRPPGRIYQYQWTKTAVDDAELQERIREAGAGVIDLDHLLLIAQYFGALPEAVTIIEVEPVDSSGGEGLSAPVAALLPEVIALVRQETGLFGKRAMLEEG